MSFTNIVYHVACFKNDICLKKYMDKLNNYIKYDENDVCNLLDKFQIMIKNNTTNNISYLKLYENNLLESFIIFDFTEEKETNFTNNENECTNIIYKNDDDKNNVMILVNVKIKDKI